VEFAVPGGPGRPAEFCRRAHRQRHYEARRLAGARGIGPDEVLIGRGDFDAWRDLVYVLEAAMDDVDRDLAGRPALRDYTEAFLHLYDAATGLRYHRIEPRAVGRD
jgi:hypothetical protein